MDPKILETANARVVILPERGALVSSFKIKDDEILWMPSTFDRTSTAWPGGGLPFLFPFAGRVWHQGQLHHYGLDSHIFPMPLHGFAWGAKGKLYQRH